MDGIGNEMILFYDFYYFWAASRLVTEGESCYDYQAYAALVHQAGFPFDEQPAPFPYPPWTLPLIYPLGLFEFKTSAALFFIFSLITISICVLLVVRALCDPPLIGRTRAIIGAAAISFPPFWKILLWGQITVLHFSGLALFVHLYRKRKDFLAGVCLTLTLVKIHLFLIFFVALIGMVFRTQRWQVLKGLCSGFLLLLSVTIVAFPRLMTEYASVIVQSAKAHLSIGASVASMLAQFEAGYFYPAVFGGALFLLATLWRDEDSLASLLTVALPLSIIAAPYAWSHDFHALFPAYIVVVSTIAQKLSRIGIVVSLLYITVQFEVMLLLDLDPQRNFITGCFPILIFILLLFKRSATSQRGS